MSELSIGYAAMLEQFHPTEAVSLQCLCGEQRLFGSDGVRSFPTLGSAAGESSFVWNVLAALGERTAGDMGPGVTTPTFRWHPAMVAQASATLAAMYRGATGSGSVRARRSTSTLWGRYGPEAPERINRLFEAIEIIKRLFSASLAGKDTKFSGQFYKLESTRLWTMPAVPPEILVATAGPVTAKRAGKNADGLITVAAPIDKISGLFTRFAEGAREAGQRSVANVPSAPIASQLGADRRRGDPQRARRVAQWRDAFSEERYPFALRAGTNREACAPRRFRRANGGEL